MKLARFFIYYLLGLIGIIALSSSPSLMQGTNTINFRMYMENIWELINGIISQEWTYQFRGQEYTIFSFLWEPYMYSMTILISGLLIGFGLAFIFAVAVQFLPGKAHPYIKRIFFLAEAVPDVMVAFLLQMLVVYVFQKTDILLMRFATLGDEKIYLAPITVLSILPMISLFRILILLIEEELNKYYAEFARSKGVKHHALVIFHVIRNILKDTFRHSKLILWGSLSSLVVIEYIFNIQGLFRFVMEDFRPIVIAVSLMMVFTPFYFVYQGVEILAEKSAFRFDGWKLTPDFSFPSPGQPWKQRIRNTWKTVALHFRNLKFAIGFTVIITILLISFLHPVIHDEAVQQFNLIYDEEGNLVSSKPHPPSKQVWLGTDRNGFSILDQLITGAKYTIMFAGTIAFLRLLSGFLFAIPYAFFTKEKWRRRIERFIDGFHFLPLSLIAIILLRPVLMGTTSGFAYSFTERIVIEAIILTLLVVPLTMVLIGNEIKAVIKKDFIESARVAGGGLGHLLFRHIMPHLHAKLGIIFGQQFIQVLLILIHLGIFNMFLGGTSMMLNQTYRANPYSDTFEWSGLVSGARNEFMGGQEWIFLPVFIGFVLLIICMQLIIEGIQEVQQEKVGIKWNKKKVWQIQRKNDRRFSRTSKESEAVPEKFNLIKNEKSLNKRKKTMKYN